MRPAWLREAGISVLLILALCGVGSASGFLNAVGYPAGPVNLGVAVGDFNGDGKLDLAVASSGIGASASRVSVLLGNGDGSFQLPLRYALGYHPMAVAVADFNRDGKLDIAFVGGDLLINGNVGVLLGNGDGTFQAPITYPGGGNPQSIVAGDFNGDGIADVAVGVRGTFLTGGGIGIFLGNGDGTLQAPITVTGVVNAPLMLAAGDFNGDRNLDLVYSSIGLGTEVSVMLGNGDGTFQAPQLLAFTSFPEGVAVADLNHDGNLDVVSANSGSLDVSVFLGNGDGTFQAPVNYPAAFGAWAVAIGDFNGDRQLDLAVANFYRGSVSVLLGNGDGTFQRQVVYWVGIRPDAIAAGDFSGDGALDLVTANFGPVGHQGGNVTVLINAGSKRSSGARGRGAP